MTKQKINMRRQSSRGAVRKIQPEKNKFSIKKISVFVLLLIVGAVYADFHYKRWIASAIAMPIKTVKIKSQYKFLQKEELQRVLKKVVVGNFFEVNLSKVKRELETIPLVHSVALRRIWPDSIMVTLEEEEPIARWESDELIDSAGRLIKTSDVEKFNYLPHFKGSVSSRHLLVEQYTQLARLFRQAELDIRQLVLEKRGAWYIGVETQLGDAVTIMVGRNKVEEKIRRFLRVYQSHLKGEIANVKVIDIRYTNGISIGRRDEHQQRAAANNS